MVKPRKWVVLIPLLAGIAAIVVLKQGKMTPVQEPLQERPRLVRVITVPSVEVVPRTSGHGTGRPARTWEAVSQVKGRIVEKHPRLEKGAFLEEGRLILRIDPTDYELAIARTEADIQATRAQLQEIDIRAANTRTSLQIEEAALALNEKELQRKRKLVGQGSVSRSDLESQERALLGQQQSVQAQKNTLNLIPSQRALLEAQLARHEASLATARRDLANTSVHLPFNARIAAVNVEREQYVREGEVLAVADDLSLAEVEVQIPIEQMASLMNAEETRDLSAPVALDHERLLKLQAEVRLSEGDISARWDARFARVSDTLDPKTRTVGVIVEVEKPYAEVRIGSRPPLLKGLFVEVELAGAPRPDSIVVPRFTLHGDRIYVVDAQQRLEMRRVEVELVQDEFVVIRKGLAAGERVVVSDLVPAIDNMLLKPREDERTLQQLLQAAAGAAQP